MLSASCPYVSVRPVGPSMIAGLSRSRSACRSTYSPTGTSGIVTSGLVLLMIIAPPWPWTAHYSSAFVLPIPPGGDRQLLERRGRALGRFPCQVGLRRPMLMTDGSWIQNPEHRGSSPGGAADTATARRRCGPCPARGHPRRSLFLG